MKYKYFIATIFLIPCLLLTACSSHSSDNARRDASLQCPAQHANFAEKNVVLNTTVSTVPAIFVLHNTSSQKIWLNHESNSGMSAGWASSLSSQHWSAIQLTQLNFSLQCTDMQFKTINCSQVLQVCNLLTKQPNSNAGSFWLTEDQPLNKLLPAIIKRF